MSELQRKVLTIKEVITVTGLGRSTIYRMIPEGEFPKQIKLSRGRVAWRTADIEQWIDERPFEDGEGQDVA